LALVFHSWPGQLAGRSFYPPFLPEVGEAIVFWTRSFMGMPSRS